MEEKLDVLNRHNFIDNLITIVETIAETEAGICFAIDGEWGTGKTFVLEKFEQSMKIMQSEETADNKFFVFHYNCWKYDYYEEPSIAIISAMLDAIDDELSIVDPKMQAVWEKVKESLGTVAGKFVENHIGVDIVEVYKDIVQKKESDESKRREFDHLFAFNKTLDFARTTLQEIAQNKTILIIVDELDRCLPEYGIRVLERLHHLFDGIDKCIVIISTDKKQLTHSVQSIYGNVEVNQYLKKFISFTMSLDNGSVSSQIFEKYKSYFSCFESPDTETEKVIEKYFFVLWNNIDIRTQEKLMEKGEMIHKIVFQDKEKKNLGLFIFEMLVLRYYKVGNENDLYWIAEICTANITSDTINAVGNSHYEFLKSQCESSIKGVSGAVEGNPNKQLMLIRKDITGIAFTLLSEVYSEENIYYCDTDSIKSLYPLAKEFCQLNDSLY